MNVIILKVKGKKNLAELDDSLRDGHTLTEASPARGHAGWQMPKTAQPGDLAIWYSAAPHQRYVAYGRVAGVPRKPPSERVKYYGPVREILPLPNGPQPRKSVAAKSGVNGTSVAQLAQTVPADRAAAFLRPSGSEKDARRPGYRLALASDRQDAQRGQTTCKCGNSGWPEWASGRTGR